jgi:hypothetical protein
MSSPTRVVFYPRPQLQAAGLHTEVERGGRVPALQRGDLSRKKRATRLDVIVSHLILWANGMDGLGVWGGEMSGGWVGVGLGVVGWGVELTPRSWQLASPSGGAPVRQQPVLT